MSDDNKSAGSNVLEKIMNLIRDDTRNLRDAILDSSGTKMYEKHIDVARENLQQAKSAITEEMAKELQCSRKVKIFNERVKQQEQRIIDALAQDDEVLAFELATEMVSLEQDQKTEAAVLHSHQLHLGHLTRHLEQAERTLKDLERQLAMVQTTTDIQLASEAITKNFAEADVKMLSAKRSLERIRKKQQQVDEQYEVDGLSSLQSGGKLADDSDQESTSKQPAEGAADVLKRIIDKE